jgi:hypothetical protein
MEKKLYILFDESGKVLGQGYFSLGEQPALSTDILPTETFVVAYFNRDLKEYYEGATEEEIAEFNRINAPFSVTKRQLKQALVLSGIGLTLIDSAINEITDETERILMKLYWEESNEFERNHPKLREFAQSINITERQIDELFILASKLL